MPKSPILPLAAAVTAVALSVSPAQATPLLGGKRDEVKIVAFPLLAVKGQMSASVEGHVSHSSHQSHQSGTGGHVSHVSHHSHISSVPTPGPTSVPVATQPPVLASPTPDASAGSGGLPSAVLPSGSLPSSSADLGSGSPSTASGGGCAFVIVAPVSALVSWIRRLTRRGRAR